jgi:hypothetical protein
MARLLRDHRHLDDLLGRCVWAFTSEDFSSAVQAIAAFDRELRRHTSLEDEHILERRPGGKLVPSPQESDEKVLRQELAVEHVQVRELSGMLLRLVSERSDLKAARAMLPNLLRRWEAHTSREEAALQSLRWPNEEPGEFFLPGWLGM